MSSNVTDDVHDDEAVESENGVDLFDDEEDEDDEDEEVGDWNKAGEESIDFKEGPDADVLR